MQRYIKLTMNCKKPEKKTNVDDFNLHIAQKAKRFHESFDQYNETPLVQLDNLAAAMGIKKIFVKDESFRFNLNAFKVLGGSFAIGSLLAKRLGMDIDDLPYNTMISDEIKEQLGDITFITATDGNHGKGIAWTAQKLKQKAVVYMPKDSVQYRLDQISAMGAEVNQTDCHFDDTVRIAFEESKKNGWLMTQDTAFEDYQDFPKWCMQGYTTMALETWKQLEEIHEKPSHIIIQAGAGSLSGGLLGFFSSVYGNEKPFSIIVEASKADCIRRTAEDPGDGLHFITGDISTIMAGLSVGEPSAVGWKILRSWADAFTACDDCISAKGIRVLANPIKDDTRIIAGESGSPGVGSLVEILSNPDFSHIREQLHLDENSKVLCFNTEGDTDPESYRSIVWDGKYPSC